MTLCTASGYNGENNVNLDYRMNYSLLTLAQPLCDETSYYLEGVTFAANLATKPTAPETWLSDIFGDQASAVKTEVEQHITQQYQFLKASEYSLLGLLEPTSSKEQLADFAEGFMTLWPVIEPQWAKISLSDGTMRMLQAMLTTFMLAIDQEQTQQQMRQAGVEQPPELDDLLPQLDLMMSEVAQAADEAMVGAKSQSVNPYKQIGRNDPCPCGSGKKFKQCCG